MNLSGDAVLLISEQNDSRHQEDHLTGDLNLHPCPDPVKTIDQSESSVSGSQEATPSMPQQEAKSETKSKLPKVLQRKRYTETKI